MYNIGRNVGIYTEISETLTGIENNNVSDISG